MKSRIDRKYALIVGAIFVVFVASFIVRSARGDEPTPASTAVPATTTTQTKETTPAPPAPTDDKALARGVFGGRLLDYSETLGLVSVDFATWKFERKSIENEIQTFMIALMKDTTKTWDRVLIRAYAPFPDKYGKTQLERVYVIGMSREEASKVTEWRLANLEKLGDSVIIDQRLR